MTSSLGEVRLILAEVAERVREAYRHASTARARLADAAALLEDLAVEHGESLVPPALVRAGDELDRGLRLIAGGVDAVADLDARL